MNNGNDNVILDLDRRVVLFRQSVSYAPISQLVEVSARVNHVTLRLSA